MMKQGFQAQVESIKCTPDQKTRISPDGEAGERLLRLTEKGAC
jgi:hypothetical protein